MGQKIGKVALLDVSLSFTNLPKRAILSLWQAFNNVADGFGVREDELESICVDLKDELNLSRVAMAEKIASLFKSFDTDQNGLIDALEFFSTIAVISGMKKRAILEFVLTVYDFDGTESLCMDEVVLALKSVATGLCKLQPEMQTRREKVVQAKEEQIEQLVSELFCSQAGSGMSGGSGESGEVDDSVRLPIKLLCSLLIAHPDVCSWFAFFSCPPQQGLPRYDLTFRDKDFQTENPLLLQSEGQRQAVQWDVRAQERESTVPSKEKGAVPVEQWRSAVALLTPLEYADAPLQRQSPNCSVAPEWVYGYQAETSKGNVHYTLGGEVVYNVSKYAVLYSPKTHTQRIFSGHTHEILCVAMHPSKQIIATGEIGPEPSVLVWRADSLKILHCGRGFHRNGVTQLAFSPDGRILASVGNDAQQSISVCLWEESTVLFNSPVSRSPCLSCAVLSGNTVVAAGDSFISFWSYYAEGYVRRSGNFSRFTALQPITALAPVFESENLVAGTASGLLLLWVDVNCVRSVKAHNGTINCIYSSPHGLISGGKDERIRVWSVTLEPSFTFDVSHFGMQPCIRSLCMAPDGTSILLGTRGANVYEVSAIDGSDLRGGPICVGHSVGEVYCVAAHPSRHEFLSVGQDCTLRVFDMGTRTQIKIATFDGEARAVSYNPLGDLVVVGFAGKGAKSGSYVVLREEDLCVVHEAKDSSCAISLATFSPEGETLAIGTVDGSIYLYAAHDDYELVGRCDRHRAPVTAVDFSVDGEWLRSNCVDRQLYFFNTDDASLQSNVASMRDVQWASHLCTRSWHVREVHHSAFEEQVTCIQALPLPEEQAVGVAQQRFLAAGTDQGYLRLYPFPCGAADGEAHRVPAHCGEVSALRFSCNGERLVSSGRRDRCLVQWTCLPYAADPGVARTEEQAGEDRDLRLEMLAGVKLAEDFMPREARLPVGIINATPTTAAAAALQAPVPASPENDCWLVSVVQPTVIPSLRTALPQMSLLLEHVYGYEAQTMRNSVRYTGADEIVYTVASLGVVLSTASKVQRIYQHHSDAVSAFACSRDGTLVATGQMGHRPQAVVWDTRTCQTLCVLPEAQLFAVACLAFSPDDALLAVVGMDRDHTLSVYEWRTGVCISKAYAGASCLLGAFFTSSSGDGSNDGSGFGLCTYGAQELKLWQGVATRFPTSVRPRIGPVGTLQHFLCGEEFLGRPTIGTADGFLYIFADNALKKTIKAHSGPLTAMDVCAAQKLLVTGGRDGAVRVWSADYSCAKEFVLDSMLDTANPSVRSAAFNQAGSRLVVGTRAAEIFEIDLQTGLKVGDKGSSLVQGHGVRQLWGLASHPTREECVTCGDDCTLRVWDTRTFTQKRLVRLDTASRAVAYSPDGKLLAVGFGSGQRTKGKLSPREGAFWIMRVGEWKLPVHEGKDSSSAIRVVKFSPDGKTLAIGSDDNCIYLYNVRDEFSRRSTVKAHRAPVLFLDFSQEGNYLVSVDAARSVCYTEASSGVTIPTPEALRDEKWSSCSSPFTWAAQGLWQSQAPGAEPVCAQKSWGGLLLAGGSSAGAVSVAHHPYPRRAGFLQAHAHAGPVSALAWVAGDGALLSVGGKDHALMQWRCLYEDTRESGDEGGRSCEDSEVEIDGGHELVKTHMHPNRRSSRRKNRPSPLIADQLPGEEAGEGEGEGEGESDERKNETLDEASDKWYSKICAPSNLQDDDETAPDIKADCDFAQGARLGDCRRLLRYNADGHAVYAVAALGVIFDRQQVRQRFYQGHRDAIISLDVDCTGKLAASGEQAELPELHVWCAKTGAAVTVFQRLHRQGVSSVSFSADGHSLVSLGQDAQCSVAVCYSPSGAWADGHHVCSSSVSSAKMLWCLHSTSSSAFPIVVGGAGGHVYFFRVVRGAAEKVKGVYGKRHKIQPLLCAVDGVITRDAAGLPADSAALSPTRRTAEGGRTLNVMLCGTVTGYIYVFSDTRVVNKVVAHEAPVNCICPAGKHFLTAGKEGRVKLWSADLKLLHMFNTAAYLPRPYLVSCQSVASNRQGSSFLVGMRGGEVFEVSVQSFTYCLLAEGHSSGELHALAASPTDPDEYATAGDDGVVMVWSLRRRYCLRKVRVEFASRALAWSPDGRQLLVGLGGAKGGAMAAKDGAFMVVDAASLEIIREERKAKQTITDIKFASASDVVALASSDGRVYIHGTQKFELRFTVQTPMRSCCITQIDFSADASLLRLSTDLSQLFFYSLQAGDMVNNPTEVRDVQWAMGGGSVSFTWQTQGVFRRGIDSALVTAVALHPSGRFVAASYDCGDVRIYRYPSQSQQLPFLSLTGVASVACRLLFSADGLFLVVLDGKTRAVLQFRISLPPPSAPSTVAIN